MALYKFGIIIIIIIMATPSPFFYLFKHVKHDTQNIKNDCHQWLCDSFIARSEVVFGQGSAPDPDGGAYSAPPDLV